MRRSILAAAAMVFVMVAGCNERKPPEKTVFDPQLEALKKARQVEQKVLDAAQQRADETQRQESGTK